jgi:hypothetical protein
MSDMELILQLARLEEQGENDQLGEDGIQNTSLQVDQTGESSLTPGGVPSPGTRLTTPPSAEEPHAISQLAPSGPKTHPASGDEELQALADLEKELGLDDLQLYLDSTSFTTSTPAVNGGESRVFKTPDMKSARSDSAMTAQTSGSQTSFATPASVTNTAQKVPDDDDNLDELERYLESLSAPPPK